MKSITSLTEEDSTMTFWIKNIRIEKNYIKTGDWTSGTATEKVAIFINNDKFEKIILMNEWQEPTEGKVVDGQNDLLLPGIIEKHCHLDKTKLGSTWKPVRPANSIIERFENEIPDLDALDSSIEERAQKLIDLEQAHGVVSFRSHIDVEPATGLRHFDAIKKKIAADGIKAELVVFPQHGLLRSNSVPLVEQALAKGADYIGGVDPYTLDGDYKKSLATTFDLAKKYHVGIDIHSHNRDEAGRKTLLEIVRLTREYNLQDQVYLSHAFGLNDFTAEERQPLFSEMAILKIHIVSSIPVDANTIPPLDELQAAGVQVHIGCDNVDDSWSSLGNGSIPEKLARYLEMYQISTQEGLSQSLGLITDGITPLDKSGTQVWPQVNDDASFILTPASCSAEFVARKSSVNQSYASGQKIK